MEKLELLLEKYPEKVLSMIDILYKENFKKTKKEKTIFHFQALGKRYDSNIFTENYINFLSDVSKIHPYEFFLLCIDSYYIKTDPEQFDESHKLRNQIHKVTEGIYSTGYSSTAVKIRHIQNICNMMGIELIQIS